MKSINRNSAIAVALFLYLWTVQPASAFYDPNLQRWVNRDPIQERGGINLYSFAANRPVELIDSFGLQFAGEPLGLGPQCKCIAYVVCNLNVSTPATTGGFSVGGFFVYYGHHDAWYDCWISKLTGECSSFQGITTWTERKKYSFVDFNGSVMGAPPNPRRYVIIEEESRIF